MKPLLCTTGLMISLASSQAQLFQNLSTLADRIPVGRSEVAPGTGSRLDGPKWLCTGDFDGDSHADMATTHVNGDVSIVWGNGHKQFSAPLVLASGMTTLRGIVCRDFTGDGRPDLIAAGPMEGRLVLWRGLGSRQFASPVAIETFPGARNLDAGDFDGDGILDLAVAGPDRNTNAAPGSPTSTNVTGLIQLKGRGAGAFERVATVPEVGVAATPNEPLRPLYTVKSFRPPGEAADWVAVTHADSSVLWWLNPVNGRLTVAGSVRLAPVGAELGGGVRAVQIGSVTARSGAMDLLTANSETGTVEVRKRRPAGQPFGWEDAVAQRLHIPFGPRSMELCDMNSDGWLDLVVTVRNADRLIVFKNNNGTLEQSSESTSGRSPREMAVADFNEDGFKDFAVVNRESFDISILAGGPPRADSLVAFQALDQVYAVDGSPGALVVANLNGDVRDDVIQLHRASGEVSVRLTGPGGRLADPVFYPMGTRPNALSVVDFDHDGRLDLVTANLGASSTGGATGYRKGLGNGSFGSYEEASIATDLARLGISAAESGSLYAIEYGDLDNDGITDAVAGFIDCRILFYKGQSEGTFQLVTTGYGLDHVFLQFIFEARGFALADFDQDGDLDIAAIGMYGELGTIENKGDLLRTDRQPLVVRKYGATQSINNVGWTAASRSLVVRDVNGDGDPDLLAGLKLGTVAFLGQPGVGFAVGQIWDASVPPPRSFSAPVVNFAVSAMAQGDFDHDGRTDLAIACDIARCVEIQTRNAYGGWDRALRVAAPSAAFLASGDLDGDGKADLVGTGEVLWVALSGRPAASGPPLTQAFSRSVMPHPVINEIMAQNSSVAVSAPNFTVEPGDNPDYVEIFHGGSNAVNLAGWTLSCANDSTTRTFTFPAEATIPARGRLVVRCSHLTGGSSGSDLWRTGWDLPQGGGTLNLSDAAGTVVDTIAYPKQLKNVSYGRYLDGLPNFVFNGLPDPGRANVDNGPLAPRIDFDGFKAGTYGPGQNTLFRCECRDDTAPIACTLVYWRTDIADPARHRVLLYDDGTHDDGGVLDGHWAGRLLPALPEGASIAFYIEATDLDDLTSYAPIDPNSTGDDDNAATGFFRLAITAPEPSLEISEVVTRNKRFTIDGATPDYIEVRNTGLAPVDLTGVSLAGKLFEDAPRYTFPAGRELAPGESLLVYASGGTGPFDAPFRFDSDGGSFYLMRATADPATQGLGFLDSVVIPPLSKNEAWFRLGAAGPWTKGIPTPGSGNVLPGRIVLGTALDEADLPVLTVAIPTIAGQPWQIQSSSDLTQWTVFLSGDGNGIEQSAPVTVKDRRSFFRSAAP